MISWEMAEKILKDKLRKTEQNLLSAIQEKDNLKDYISWTL